MSIRIDEDMVDSYFDEINKQYFSDELTLAYELDIFTEDEQPNELGYCVPEDDGYIVLGLVEEFPSMDDFLATLKHEMIHMEQITNNRPVNHGKAFISRATEIGASH
jgi:hypothetical protein